MDNKTCWNVASRIHVSGNAFMFPEFAGSTPALRKVLMFGLLAQRLEHHPVTVEVASSNLVRVALGLLVLS